MLLEPLEVSKRLRGARLILDGCHVRCSIMVLRLLHYEGWTRAVTRLVGAETVVFHCKSLRSDLLQTGLTGQI